MFITHEVQPGETLETIARHYSVSVPEITEINEISNPQVIRTRVIIRIPVPIIPPTIPSPRPIQNISSRVINGILYIFSTDRMFYFRGQSVRLLLVKINITSRPITLTYNTSQRFDFFVRRGLSGPIIWQWSEDRVFTQVVQRITLQPGESQIFRATWNQETNEGRQVTPGVYRILAENVARELRGRRIPVLIRIR
ncbi:BsuPI-related putative proteinase inhibitor [Metallumcola ferriviriculae]|uniref:LysM domain-containing protein n=1 Tax=Metallumcola ferriviriculae TaxID=3039180 RepID=A0AAU0UKK0_9FIRM|nr:BsuPI-related putative proteinase inhibitor [Desulfitibacteraceae bacterium MK1]